MSKQVNMFAFVDVEYGRGKKKPLIARLAIVSSLLYLVNKGNYFFLVPISTGELLAAIGDSYFSLSLFHRKG